MSDEALDPMATLVERIARTIHWQGCVCPDSTAEDVATARAVLADLVSTGNLLADPDDLRGSVGVVLLQLREAKAEIERLKAERGDADQ